MSDQSIGVVLLNLGGPAALEEIPDFLKRLLSDPQVLSLPWPLRPLLASLIAKKRSPKVAAHYQAIGGKSPISAQTRQQVEALKSALGAGYTVRYVFRHAKPFAAQVLASLADSGVRRLVALPAYPQYSKATSGSALAELDKQAKPYGFDLRHVDAYPDAAGYIEALLDLARPTLKKNTHVLVSAHGIPQKFVYHGDPYVEHVQRSYAALVQGLPSGCTSSLAFQSRLGPVAWTRPYLVDEVARLAEQGVFDLALLPISFVCENLETLYELDREVAGLARAKGIKRFRRVPTPGCHPAFVAQMAALVRRAATELQ